MANSFTLMDVRCTSKPFINGVRPPVLERMLSELSTKSRASAIEKPNTEITRRIKG